ncbi:hypothetical protein D3C78_1077240 [compost metagenome]
MVFLCMMLILSVAIQLPLYLKGSLLMTAFATGQERFMATANTTNRKLYLKH